MHTMKTMSALALGSAVTLAGCASPAASIEKVPVGTTVEVIRQDGGVVRGTLSARDERTVNVDTGATSRSVTRSEITELRVVDAAKPAPLPPAARFREFTVPEGTTLTMRLGSDVGSDTSRVEDPIQATLSEAIVIDGVEVFPAGSLVKGTITAAQAAGKVKGRASLALRFTSVTVAGRDESSVIEASRTMSAQSTEGKDAATIAIPAAGGAIIGAIVGGKKGAAIGTAVGGGGGAAVVLSTAGHEIRLERGAALTLPMAREVEVRVPIAQSN